MAGCLTCHQEMTDSVPCTDPEYDIGGTLYTRIPNGDETCHDCKTPPGGLHHPGCDSERCPRCAGQAIGCGCGDPAEETWLDEVPF